MNPQFKKGQTVYTVSVNFCQNQFRFGTWCLVLSRVVDACGAKQVTFFDRGNDGIYGRKRRLDFEQAWVFAWRKQKRAEAKKVKAAND